MGRPKGSKNGVPSNKPAEGASVMGPTPVRAQVRELSGFSNVEELKEALPESTAVGSEAGETRKTRKPRATAEPIGDMADPRYRDAVSNMTAFGGARAIKTAFSGAGKIMKEPKIALSEQEGKLWDDYFYVVGKKSNFDPTKPWYLAVYAIVLLAEQVVLRLWETNAGSFANEVGKFFGIEPDEQTEEQVGVASE